ncbi:MAG: Uma2 family endonuclease, partial [Candidatus Omnitrophica bacterium]|nr:Uma2 family endonuclease [Candidatus Omnitrophota bacterium]
WEIIDGVAYDMSPAPSVLHQTSVGSFYAFLNAALRGRNCRPFVSPVDVVFSESSVVQPDVFVVCDPNKITEKNIQGAPDLVIEILSPSTSKKDRWDKKDLYEQSGVREYIIVDPQAKYAERYILGEDGRYDRGAVFDENQSMALTSMDNLEMPLQELFSGIPAPE